MLDWGKPAQYQRSSHLKMEYLSKLVVSNHALKKSTISLCYRTLLWNHFLLNSRVKSQSCMVGFPSKSTSNNSCIISFPGKVVHVLVISACRLKLVTMVTMLILVAMLGCYGYLWSFVPWQYHHCTHRWSNSSIRRCHHGIDTASNQGFLEVVSSQYWC